MFKDFIKRKSLPIADSDYISNYPFFLPFDVSTSAINVTLLKIAPYLR